MGRGAPIADKLAGMRLAYVAAKIMMFGPFLQPTFLGFLKVNAPECMDPLRLWLN
jgi:hypothetical protein